MISKRKEILLKVAANVATLSNFKYKLGAVLCKQHKIISSGCNSDTVTDPIQSRLDTERHGCYCPGKLHAETSTLLPFIKKRIDISGSELYIARVTKAGSYGMARPCPSCMKLIKQCGIKKIYYTTNEGYAEEYIINNEEV